MEHEKSNRIYTLFLHTGYVESGSNACLVAHHPRGFDSLELALKNLAELIVKPMLDELMYEAQEKSCTCDDKSKGKFCSKCGKPKEVEVGSVDRKTMENLVYRFIHGNADSTGFMWEYIFESGWSFGAYALSPEKLLKGVAVVHEYTESLLWAAYSGKIELGEYQHRADDAEYSFYLQKHSKVIC